MSDLTDITLAILAGGEGSRFGKPKGLLRVNDRAILEFLLDRLSWSGPTMLVTSPGRERPPGTGQFDREVVDPAAGLGPLRGILTALQHTSTPLVVVTAVDMPLFEVPHLRQLVEAIHARPALRGLMTRQTRQVQPFPGIFHLDANDVLKARLEAQQLSVRALMDDPRFAAIEVGWSPNVWLNVNTAADAQRFKAQNLRIE